MKLGEVAKIDEQELRRMKIIALRMQQEQQAQEKRDKQFERWVNAAYEVKALQYDRGLKDGRRSFVKPIPETRYEIPVEGVKGDTGRVFSSFRVVFLPARRGR